MATPIQSFSIGSQKSEEPQVGQKPRRTAYAILLDAPQPPPYAADGSTGGEADRRLGGRSASNELSGDREIFMQWIVRVLGLGVVGVFAALLAAGCGGSVQVDVGGAPVVAVVGRASCASVCQQMAACPGKGPTCAPGCQSAQSLASQAGCDGSLQAELDCLGAQSSDVCSATRTACQTQTLALGACITNFCGHERMGSPNQALCLQAAAGF